MEEAQPHKLLLGCKSGPDGRDGTGHTPYNVTKSRKPRCGASIRCPQLNLHHHHAIVMIGKSGV